MGLLRVRPAAAMRRHHVRHGGRPENPDIDNLAKNLLDVLQGFAYDNDRQVDHLDLVRLHSRSTEAFMTVRIARTDIDGVRDVISPTFPVEWVTSTSMTDVSAYLEAADEPSGEA